MHAAADGGPFWDTGDDRSQAFAPAAALRPVKARLPVSRNLAEAAANDEPALEALFPGGPARATG